MRWEDFEIINNENFRDARLILREIQASDFDCIIPNEQQSCNPEISWRRINKKSQTNGKGYMKNRLTLLHKQAGIFGLLFFLLSCQQEEVAKEPMLQPVNSFSMQLNGQDWQPSMIGEDKCMRTFN